MITFLVLLSTIIFVFVSILREVVVINKIIARVVRWVNINHLDLAKISLTDNFQHIKVVTFNVKILRVVKVHASLSTRAKRLCGRRIC